MKFKKIDRTYLIKLFNGEEIVKSLTSFCKEQSILTGSISGIGGGYDITLGYYNLDTKEYTWRTFSDIHEIVSMNGNISLVDNQPFLHIHTSISDKSFSAFGGHLKEAFTAATCEIFISPGDKTITRELDIELGLMLLDLQ